MSILQEVIKNFRRLDAETPESKLPSDSVDDENDDDLELDLPPENEGDDDEIAAADVDDEDALALDGVDPADEPSIPDPTVPTGSGASASGTTDSTPADDENDLSLEDPDSVDGSQASDDPDHQGVLRTVKGAHLVYKRESGDGGFEELWIYNIGTLKDELETRKAILAGTDIPVNKTSSEDGSQTYTIWSAGNAELVHITGLQN